MLTPKEAAEKINAAGLAADPHSIAELAKRGIFPGARKIGGRWLIPSDEIDNFIAQYGTTTKSGLSKMRGQRHTLSLQLLTALLLTVITTMVLLTPSAIKEISIDFPTHIFIATYPITTTAVLSSTLTPSAEPQSPIATPTPSLRQLAHQEFARLDTGRSIFTVPTRMTVGETRIVRYRLGYGMALTQTTLEAGVAAKEGDRVITDTKVRISSRMKAILDGGDAFTITPIRVTV